MVKAMKAIAAVVALLASTAALTTNSPVGNACGTMANKEWALVGFGRFFTEPEYAVGRDPKGVQQVSPTDSIYVVSDPATCDTVMAALLAELRKDPGWAAWEESGYEHAVFRYGPYYAVHLRQHRDLPPDVIHAGYTSLLVLRKSDLAVLAAWAV